MDTGSNYVRCAIALVATSVQQVNSIGSCFRVRVRSKEVQAMSEPLLHSCLKAVVVASALCDCITVALAEIRELKAALGGGVSSSRSWASVGTSSICKLGTGRQESGRIVGIRKDLKMPRQ